MLISQVYLVTGCLYRGFIIITFSHGHFLQFPMLSWKLIRMPYSILPEAAYGCVYRGFVRGSGKLP
jgi:hypothetical protein